GILIEDTKGLITFVNPSLEQIIGYKSKELIGKHWKHIIPKEDLLKIKGKTNSRSRTQTEKYEARLKAKDGRIIPVLISAQTLLKGGKFVGVLSAFSDITDLVDARKEAQTASQAKSEFLANMSHEIRTPMNGIIGMTELALGTKLSREQFGYLEAIKEAGESLMTIINDILDFSKIEARKIEIESLDFNFRDSLGDIVSAMAFQAHKKDIELVYRVNSDIPDYLIGDPGRLRQILLNLISNAIKFTHKGEVSVEVRVKERDDRRILLQFTVRDTGIGIPEKQLEKIFLAFTQVDGSTTRKYGGTGLGLSISSQLVHLMDGDIWVESKTGEGSRFHFTIRLGIQKEPKEQLIPVELLEIRDLPVLVVDDNATNRFLLKEMLTNWNMKPTLASSGRSGLNLLKQGVNQKKPIALAIIDSQMPEMDGFELARRIQSNPLFRKLRIMMLTSSGMRGDAARCRELGILAYLTKPVKQSELLNTIMIVLSKDTVQSTPEPLITKYSIREGHKRLRILVAEDNPINQKVAAHILQKYGNTVILANNGKEALEALKKEEFDLILMDVQMPVMDGFQATAAIRKTEKTTGKHIPIIALTAHAMKGDKEKCLEAGMDDYVSKPIKPDILFQTIDEQMLTNRSEE
ncbi:MAG: response regulator, partial [Candidatus Aminicenantes bacterium]|nr:response regulator [Candidatus Aminicenantes bacterium]